MEFEIDGPFPLSEGATTNAAPEPIDRTRIEAVETALEERIIAVLAEVGDHMGEQQMDAAKSAAILFGCWRSLQPELDRAGYAPSPFADLRDVMAAQNRRKKSDPGEGEEEADGEEAG